MPVPGRAGVLMTAIAVAVASAACSSTRDQLDRHQQKLQSLASTADAVASAWLDGTISGTYARTALEQTFTLVEQERSGLTAEPQMVANPDGARLADAADQLARTIAGLAQQVAAADAGAVRRHLSELPMRPAGAS